MFELKREIELQADTFITADLFYYGSNYDVKGKTNWVELKYIPVTYKIEGSNISCTVERGDVIITATDTSITKAMELIEELVAILQTSNLYNYDNTITFDQGSLENDLWYCSAKLIFTSK